MKKLTKTLSLVLVVAMVLGLCVIGAGASYSSFTDKDKITKDYSEAVEVMTDLGCVSGMNATTFAPAGNFTRAQAAVILTRLTLGANADAYAPTKVTFKDVPTSFWGYRYIEYAVQSGYVAGTGNGNYSPNATLTGYQWAAMLLKVLNITVPTTGTDWQINTAKAYYGTDKFSEVAISAAAITREAATQMAYDALFRATGATEGYPVLKSVSGGTPVVVGYYDTNNQAVAQAAMLDAIDTDSNNTYSFGDLSTIKSGTTLAGTVFGVNMDPNKTDSFGRPSHVYTCKTTAEGTAYGWTNKTKTVANVPVLTYTTTVTSAKLFADLGLTANVAAANVAFVVDGAAEGVGDNTTNSAVEIAYNGTTTYIGGTGVLTEVYKTSSTTYKIVEVNTYIGAVNSVAAATAVSKRTVSVAGVAGTLANETLARADVVLYTKAWDATLTVPAYVLKSVAVPESVTGSVTKTTSANVYTIGGTDYAKSAKYDGDVPALGATGSWYLDSYKNVIGVKEATTATVYYGYLLAYAYQQYTPADLLGSSAKNAAEVFKFVDSTGAVVTKNGAFTTNSTTGKVVKFVANATGTASASLSAVTWTQGNANTLFAYTLDASGNISTVANPATTAAATKTLTKGDAVFDTRLMTDATVVFYVSNKGTDSQKVAAYVGYVNTPTKTTTAGYEYAMNAKNTGLGGLALQVADVDASTTAKYVYFATADKSYEATIVNGANVTVTTYTNVYLDGVKGELKFTNDPMATAGQLYTYTTSTTTGISTLATPTLTVVSDELTSIQSTYFIVASGAIVYTDANTVYYQVDPTAKTVTPVKALTALSASGAYSVNLMYNDKGNSADNAADVVYFYVGD